MLLNLEEWRVDDDDEEENDWEIKALEVINVVGLTW